MFHSLSGLLSSVAGCQLHTLNLYEWINYSVALSLLFSVTVAAMSSGRKQRCCRVYFDVVGDPATYVCWPYTWSSQDAYIFKLTLSCQGKKAASLFWRTGLVSDEQDIVGSLVSGRKSCYAAATSLLYRPYTVWAKCRVMNAVTVMNCSCSGAFLKPGESSIAESFTLPRFRLHQMIRHKEVNYKMCKQYRC